MHNCILVEDSTGDKQECTDFMQLLSYLIEPHNSIRCFWDLNENVAVMLKLFPKASVEALAEKARVRLGNTGFTLYYRHSKLLRITYGNQRYEFYHLKQFFEPLGITQEPDLQETKTAARALETAFQQIGLPVNNFISAIANYRDAMLPHFNLPKYDFHKEMSQYAYQCIGKTWIEAYKLGYFETAYDYDMTAAYPYFASQVYDYRYAKVTKADTMQKCHYGFVKGKITVDKNSPVQFIPYNSNDGIIYPTGSWIDVLPISDISTLYKFKNGTFSIEKGIFAVQQAPVFPLKKELVRLFTKRTKANSLQSYLIKMISNGLIGLFSQVYDDGEPAPYFNPILAAQIYSQTRCNVANFIYTHKIFDDLLHVSTDGLLSTAFIDLPTVKKMGTWRMTGQGPALVLGAGTLWYNNKKPRGITLSDVLNQINANPSQSYYKTQLQRKRTLIEAHRAGDITQTGNAIDTQTTIDLVTQTHGRVFKKLPRTGRELIKSVYESAPPSLPHDHQ